ncbi:hypothetical protein TRIUR3_30433 [Triticum urartu]|uniref:N-acetyltransferase domain-containing protein n=1 Tax=Triticum urartu TaxID=4572 RepID=M8A426_TRIUA|nr:hypothetical protein TRIUR3_30433 [Triticum urartu]
MSSAACASVGAQRAWDDELVGVSDGVAVRLPRRTEGCNDEVCCSFPAGPVAALAAGRLPCLPTKQEVVAVGGAEEERYLAREAGWGVRRMGRIGEEMRRVALVQAEAFHVPVALFNDFFFDFFKAPFEKIIGVVDCTVQDEGDILRNLQGVQEYFYVSGIAVLPSYRYEGLTRSLLLD